MDNSRNSRGQVTIFIIIAILIVAAVVSFFTFREELFGTAIPSEFEPIYNSFLNCLEEDLLTGIDVLESQGGYIYLPEFERGSQNFPFSSQLNFVGNPLPYWYYVSSNGVQKEQVPTKSGMEKDLGDFVENQISSCSFESYYDEGFEISFENADAKINVKNSEVDLDLGVDMVFSKGDETLTIDNYHVVVNSFLGKLYDSAIEVYEKEQEDLFLENYAIDFLRLYAPVDGVELTCAPKVWEANEVFDSLQDAIEVNTLALKAGNDAENYYDIDLGVDEEVRFVNSRTWPNSFEVLPSEESFLIANPVGNQPGLGILGFCYVPYHFVYNINYPVLAQVMKGDEVFQFPMAVVVLGNQPREALTTSALDLGLPELCKYKNTLVNVGVYDTNSNLIDANISYECFGSICEIGETVGGTLEKEFPQCVNGQIKVRSEGYRDAGILYSTVDEGSINIILDKTYVKELKFRLDGSLYDGEAFITYSSGDFSRTISYPYEDTVELSEGEYEFQVYVYKNSSLELGATTSKQCVNVPRGIVLGSLGLTKKECFEVEIPEQIISASLAAGGTESHNILESDLINSDVLEINVESLPTPTTLEGLQLNYILFDERGVEIRFE